MLFRSVDLAVAGSQKGMMCPAGFGIPGVSDKAMAASRKAGLRRSFFSFADAEQTAKTGYFPHIPPTPLLHGLCRALNPMAQEGLVNVHARHARLAAGVRAGVAAWGLEACAANPALASNTVTAIRTPPGVDARDVIRIGYERYDTNGPFN